jgi:hypothetical protein
MVGAPVAIVEDHCGFGGCGFPGQADDLMGRDAGFRLGPFRGVGLTKASSSLRPLTQRRT